MSLLPVGFGASGGDYTIDDSLRFRSSASAYLSRTPASAGNRRTWTLSWWAKRGALGSTGFTVFSAGTGTSGDTGELVIKYDNNYPDSLAIQTTNTNVRFTNALYRDPSAWHHVVVAFDTTQATAANRTKVYVNGEQVTSFNLSNDLAQNTDTAVNNTVTQEIGVFARINSQYFDGYLTEVQMIDGQQLTADDFGEYDDNGTWKPLAYTGTYGTNGFYLNGVGVTDQSGNGNNWTNNNLNLSTSTATTYDQMKDTPSLVDENAGNFATLNPLDTTNSATAPTNGNLTAPTNTGAYRRIGSTIQLPSSGKWYFETHCDSFSSFPTFSVGLAQKPFDTTGGNSVGTLSTEWGYNGQSGTLINNNTSISSGVTTVTTNDIMQIAYDGSTGKVWFGKNNTWQGAGSPNPATDTAPNYTGVYDVFPVLIQNYAAMSINFGQRPFAYTPPTGFLKLNTFNLPDSTIEKGSDYFNTVLYSGNSSTQSVSVGFQPDLVWAKDRTNVVHHTWTDAVRGAPLDLFSSSTSLESNDTNGLTAFNADGYSLGSSTNHNVSGHTYVGWNWKANGSGVSNTDGSVTATVSANTTAGFSIVGFTAPSGTGNFSAGHGLGVTPAMVIVKTRDSSVAPWYTWHNTFSNLTDDYIRLNATSAKQTQSSGWGAGMTSSVIGLRAGYTTVGTEDHIAYCFAEVEGYSSIGSYTGNGSADGAFIYTGFRPAFVIIKGATIAVDWYMYDSERNTYNETNLFLRANLANAELTGTPIDLTSNGFKIRSTSSAVGTSGQTYIYMAFAENPFKNANAR